MKLNNEIITRYFKVNNTLDILINWIIHGEKIKQILAFDIFSNFETKLNEINEYRKKNNKPLVDISNEKTRLKNQIEEKLKNEYSYNVKKSSRQNAKQWLVSSYCALGNCEECFNLVEEILNQNQDHELKFWALLSYFKTCNSTEKCHQLISDSINDQKTRWLSEIWLSENNDQKKEEIIKVLQEKQNPYLMFALAHYPKKYFIENIIDLLEKFVKKCDKEFWGDKEFWYHYNLIKSTQNLKYLIDSSEANFDIICLSLLKYLNCLRRVDSGPWLQVKLKVIKIIKLYSDSIQNLTISNLDNLLLSSNFHIITNAFKVLEKSSGLEVAIKSIITRFNTLYQDSLNREEKFIIISNALKWLNRSDERIITELENVMNSCSSSEQEIARRIIMEIGGQFAMKKLGTREQLKNKYFDLMNGAQEKINDLFDKSMKEAKRGFNIAMTMDVMIFLIGFTLMAVSGFMAILNNDADKWVGIGASGGTGILSVLFSMFYSKPRERVKENINHLMNLKIIFLAYLRELNQMDQAFSQKMIESDTISESELTYFKNNISKSMLNAVSTLNKIKNNTINLVTSKSNETTPLLDNVDGNIINMISNEQYGSPQFNSDSVSEV
jgi:hypothetical protein